jgi:hypothetical protein
MKQSQPITLFLFLSLRPGFEVLEKRKVSWEMGIVDRLRGVAASMRYMEATFLSSAQGGGAACLPREALMEADCGCLSAAGGEIEVRATIFSVE